ncbi:hypothetical protein DL96DRAFT_1565690 [Flagelloscypha sp. PMI_526]|nr:hypothetical protein DL96DRAFT_1565690 [Flagelloscypha sp. PMI_526]
MLNSNTPLTGANFGSSLDQRGKFVCCNSSDFDEYGVREVLMRARSGLTEPAFETLVKEYPQQMVRLGDVCLKYSSSAVDAPGIQTQFRSTANRTHRHTERRGKVPKTLPVTAAIATTRMRESPRSPKYRRASENLRLRTTARPAISPVPLPTVSSPAQTESREVLILAPMGLETANANPSQKPLRPLPSAYKKQKFVTEQP